MKHDYRNAHNQASIAILCRSNAEVAKIHGELSQQCPHLRLSGVAIFPISWLRHVACWLDSCKSIREVKGNVLLDVVLRNEIFSAWQASGIPEVADGCGEVSLEALWSLATRENSYPDLNSLIDFVESLRTDEYLRLTEQDKAHHALISTIHKVKGLEFDRVVLVPSTASFPYGFGPSPVALAGEDEARLWYVGLTRARHYVMSGAGPREEAWQAGVKFAGSQGTGRLLDGEPAEVGISWSWAQMNWNPNPDHCQGYIKTRIRVGDKIAVAGLGKSLFHGGFQIGYLIGNLSGGPASQLKVSAVIRYPYDGNGYFGGQTHLLLLSKSGVG